MTPTLESLADGLREPFALEDVKFLPKSPMNKGTWKCLALPYADKRVYEDRLNDLAFGQWSTPPTTPFVAGNKLVIPVTVVLCGVAHTDYGEAYLSSRGRDGDIREEDNSATEAYSQGFRRACAQFRLGRYFYRLPKVWVPYDPAKKQIALSDEEKQHLVERLYRQAGLLPVLSPGQSPQHSEQREETVEAGVTDQQMEGIRKLSQALGRVVPQRATLTSVAANNLLEQLRKAYQERKAAEQERATQQGEMQASHDDDPYVQAQHLSWLTRYTQGNAAQQADLCRRFGVPSLDRLQVSHFRTLVNEMQQRQAPVKGGKAS